MWLMALAISIIVFAFTGCTRKMQPQIIYTEKTITKFDTLLFVSEKTDTIPCEDFEYFLVNKTDTIFIEVVKNELKLKTIKRIDTIYKEINIVQNLPKKVVNKIDNSVRNKAKDNSAIGNENDLKKSTKKTNWWWIYLAGALSWFIAQNVIFKGIKNYFPPLKFL